MTKWKHQQISNGKFNFYKAILWDKVNNFGPRNIGLKAFHSDNHIVCVCHIHFSKFSLTGLPNSSLLPLIFYILWRIGNIWWANVCCCLFFKEIFGKLRCYPTAEGLFFINERPNAFEYFFAYMYQKLSPR